MTALVIIAVAVPLVLWCALAFASLRPAMLRIAPWAALPALVLAMTADATDTVRSTSLVFGTSLGVAGHVTRAFLVLTASVWLGSGLFAGTYMAGDPRRVRFWGFFLSAYAGNVGLVLAQDVATFYLFYALMTFAAFGVIVHDESAEARRAGRIYLVMALAGEMLLLAAFLVIVGEHIDLPLSAVPQTVAAAHTRLVVALVLAGFGVKAGALGLHVWLPLAHPVAPTPASAVLSGSMISAGLLGWLRFLPLGVVAMHGTGAMCVVAGLAAAFYGAVVGLTQRAPKTILAYSSVSQMGFMTAVLGVGLAAPGAASVAVEAILFFALHHALAKSALFLGTGVAHEAGPGWPRRLVLIGLAWPALELAGAPLSSGALAKMSLKSVMAAAPWRSIPLGALLSVGAIGSTLLMLRFLTSVSRHEGGRSPRPGLWGPWLLLLVFDTLLFVRPPIDREDLSLLLRPENVLTAMWPVLAGMGVFAVVHRLRRTRVRASIPAGDLVVLFEAAYARMRSSFAVVVLDVTRIGASVHGRGARLLALDRWRGAIVHASSVIERRFATFAFMGFALLLLILLGVALA